jgi:hypothetical protein
MADKIMVVRHAEKPGEPPPPFGVDIDGNQDKDSLAVRGWQRAGALTCLFAKTGAAPRPRLAPPATIYATASVKHDGKSLRPQETVSAVAALLKLQTNANFDLGQEPALAASAIAAAGPVLIGWHHEKIPALANAILGDSLTVPQTWNCDRFDMVWVFDRAGAGWTFTQVPQLVLSGDSSAPI